MKNKLWLLFAIICCVTSLSAHAQQQLHSGLKAGFQNPPASAKPKVYWWCLNGNIDTVRAKEELLAMKNAGIGGFDFFEIGARRGDTMIKPGPAFLSDESLKIIKFVVDEAGKLGLEMGFNVASSWNAGGSWTLPKNAGKSLYHSKLKIAGGSGVQKIKVPFPEISFPKASLVGGTGLPMVPFQANGRPVYYEDVAILAIPANTKNSLDTNKIINVTGLFDPATDMLDWKVPSGEWEILRYVSSNSGQEVVLPSTYSAGLAIDHFDSTAVRIHLEYVINRLQSVLGNLRNSPLKTLYLASYEARGFVWTSTFPSAFKRINGYDIDKFLPSLFTPDMYDPETIKKVQRDFKRTLSELFVNNLYKQAKEISNQYGLKINSEAGGPGYPLYNAPAEPLSALGAIDVPRGEFWVNKTSGNYTYKDNNGKEIPLFPVTKEVAAASHIYNRGIVEMEAFTSFQHWQEGPFDLKPFGDRAFGEGMNRVVVHGFSHNPAGTGFPGIVYHAGTHYNDKRVWWPKIKPFNEYLTRVSYILQEAAFASDVLFYYGDKIPNAGTPKNTHFVVGPGYDYEIINTEVLVNDLKVRNGKLVLSNGATFSILALENEDDINPAVLKKLNELSRQGAMIVGAKPKKVANLRSELNKGGKGEALINQLWTTVTEPAKLRIDKKGKIYDGIQPSEILKALNVPPDITYSDKDSWLLDFVHYRKGDLDFYFISNTSNQWVSREVGFRQQSKVPELWNPMNGEVVAVPVYNQQGKYINIPLTLAPYGSYFVVFKKAVGAAPYSNVSLSGQNPAMMQFSNNGILFLNDGSFELKTKSGSKQVENRHQVQTISGAWNLSFTKGWGAPESVVLPELVSWTENENRGIKYYSGIGTYTKTFRYDGDLPSLRDQKIFLDLGDLSKVAEVWLNGHPLGITWAKPFKYDITKFIKNGDNQLKVEVANVWSNRLTGDALTGEKFTSTNIKISRNGVTWADTPLIPSGLFGPVTIQRVKFTN